MVNFTVQDLAAAIGARAEGDISLRLSSASEPATATADQLAIATAPKFLADISLGQAKAALVADQTDWQSLGLTAAILVDRPRFAMSSLTRTFDPRHRAGTPYIHPSAVIDPTAVVGAGAYVGPLCVIEAGVNIGENAWLGPHVSVLNGAKLGETATLHAGVVIGSDVVIGDRFIGHPGAVVGGDGFSFVTPEVSGVEKARETLGQDGTTEAQEWARIHSLGSVTIGNDVELGSNSCIDRGTIRDTVVGNGCKFDNLAQVGHNVQIGDNCLICAQVGIAGSSRIGNNVVLGGQTGVSDNVFVGDNAITGGATKVLANVPAGRVMLGYPAMKMDRHLEIYKALRRLPRALLDIADLKKTVSKND